MIRTPSPTPHAAGRLLRLAASRRQAGPDPLDDMSEVVFRTDPAGTWTYLNAAWTQLTGLPIDTTLGTNFLDYVHPDEVEHTVALFRAVVEGGADHCHHVTRYRMADGGYRWVELRSRLLRDPDGVPTGNVGVLLDVSERRHAEEAVDAHGRAMELLAGEGRFDELPVGVAVYDDSGTVLRVSPLLTRLLGPAMTVGACINALYERLAQGSAQGLALGGEWGSVATVLRTGRPQYGDLQVQLPAGGGQLAFHVSVLPLAQGRFAGAAQEVAEGEQAGNGGGAFALVLHDVSDLRRAERQQAAVASLGQDALTGMDLATLLDEAVELVSATLATPYCLVLELLGHGDGLLGRAAVGWPEGARSIGTIALDDCSVLGRTVTGVSPTTGDLRTTAPGKADAWLAEHGVAGCASVIIGGGRHTFGVLAVGTTGPRSFALAEVSFLEAIANVLAAAIERHRAEEETRHQALHDPLTGLANRVLLDDRLLQALHARRRRGGQSALLLMDLDRFKEVNDSLGHPAGDRVLRLVGARLVEATRETDTVSRLGGDEFAVVLPDVVDIDDALAVAHKLQSGIATVLAADGVSLHVEGSIGIAMAPRDGDDPVTLLKRADVAMYRAKRLSIGVSTYTRESTSGGVARVTYATALRKAIDEGQLVLHYQPKVNLRTGRTRAVEALVRWQHPALGLIEPDDFIPLAERTGLIRPLTRQVLSLALDQARRWQDAGHVLPVAVNVSALVLHDGDLHALIEGHLFSAGLAPQLLELELTESAVMAHPASGLSVVTRLRDAGVGLAIDDFGTGYSSLAYLRELPVQELKIDRSFIRELPSSATGAAIVRSIVELGHNLGLRVLAEGIEDAATLHALEELGCDGGQGFFLGRPVIGDQVRFDHGAGDAVSP